MLRVPIVGEDDGQVAWLRERLPENVHLVLAGSTGPAIGLPRLDRGHVYAGVMRKYDPREQGVTEAHI